MGLLDKIERRTNDKLTKNCVRLYTAIHLAALKEAGVSAGETLSAENAWDLHIGSWKRLAALKPELDAMAIRNQVLWTRIHNECLASLCSNVGLSADAILAIGQRDERNL